MTDESNWRNALRRRATDPPADLVEFGLRVELPRYGPEAQLRLTVWVPPGKISDDARLRDLIREAVNDASQIVQDV